MHPCLLLLSQAIQFRIGSPSWTPSNTKPIECPASNVFLDSSKQLYRSCCTQLDPRCFPVEPGNVARTVLTLLKWVCSVRSTKEAFICPDNRLQFLAVLASKKLENKKYPQAHNDFSIKNNIDANFAFPKCASHTTIYSSLKESEREKNRNSRLVLFILRPGRNGMQ